MGKLDVRVMACRNLHNKETFGKSDPYVVLECGGRKYKTTTKNSTLNPSWEEKFSFMLADPASEQLKLQVMDSNMMKDSLMGTYSVSLSGLVRGQVSDEWYILNDAKSGEIHLRLMAVDFGHDAGSAPSAPPMPQQQQHQQPPPQHHQQQPPPQGYPQPQPMGGQGYPPQGGAPGYPPQGGAPGYPPQGGAPGYPPPQQAMKQFYQNEDLNGQQVNGATINTCDVINSVLTNCTITKADFKGQCTLINCTTREIDVYGTVTLQGGRFEWGEVKPGGQLINQGAFVKDIDNYHGY